MTPPTPPVGARLTDEQIALVEARARFKAEHARVCGWPRGAQDECDQEHAVVCELQAHRAAARVSGGDAVERSAENHAFGEPVPQPAAPPMVLRIGDRDVPVEYHDSRPAAQQPAAQEVAPLLQRFNEWAARTRFTRTCKNPVDAGDQMGLREAYALLEEALLASLSRVAPPAPSVEAPDDYEWALARVQLLMASAYADARIHGLKLLKGFGYPDEIMSHAQDYRALSIVLRHLAAIQRAREGAQT